MKNIKVGVCIPEKKEDYNKKSKYHAYTMWVNFNCVDAVVYIDAKNGTEAKKKAIISVMEKLNE